jgi:hypothetical protein
MAAMETNAARDLRAQLRATVHYLRTIRPIVQRVATEHAAWVRLLGTALSSPGTAAPRELLTAARFLAASIATLREQLQRAVPTSSCATLHVSAIAWVETLDLLATALPGAVETGAPGELRELAREANEAQIRLKLFQRTHATTVMALKQRFAARPRIGRAPRRIVPIKRHGATRPHAAPAPVTPVNLPPWRRPRPPLPRRVAGF